MSLEEISTLTGLIVTLGGILVAAIGGLIHIKLDIRAAKKTREAIKTELLKELKELEKRVDKVEDQNTVATQVFTEVKERLASIEAKIELFLQSRQ